MKFVKRVAAFFMVWALVMSMQSVEAVGTHNMLNGLQSYKIYYGAPNAKILSQMKKYDFVIIEPYHYTAQQIRQIQANGTVVYGYISTMEAANWNAQLMSKFQEGDFFYKNGEKVHFSQWDSYLMDITSSHYQQILMSEIQNQIAAKEFDGIFLDTVGDIDDHHSGAVLTKQREGMKLFLRTISKKYPNLSLIQNWGFETLKTTTAPYVDAVMWENFHARTVNKDQWSLDRIADLQRLKKTYNMEVLTVSFSDKKMSAKLTRKYGFTHYHTSRGYNVW